MKKGFVIIGVIVVAAILAVGLFSGSEAESKKVKYEVESMTESSYVISSNNYASHADAGYKFVTARIVITNLGTESISPSVFWFKIDCNGVTYSYDINTYSLASEYRYVSVDLEKDASVKMDIVFQIPASSTGYSLVNYIPSYIKVA